MQLEKHAKLGFCTIVLNFKGQPYMIYSIDIVHMGSFKVSQELMFMYTALVNFHHNSLAYNKEPTVPYVVAEEKPNWRQATSASV